MKKYAKWMAAMAFVAGGCFGETITVKSLLEVMVDRSRLAQLDSPAYTCRQFSSHDRDSVAPGVPGWFANRDQSQFLRTETISGRTEDVMMDANGPGAIVRFWITMAGPHSGKGNLRIYLDGSETPVIEGNVFDVISRGLVADAPLSSNCSPLTEVERRGHNLYYPIPYSKSCKVTFERAGKGAFYYNINYRTYAPGVSVESYSPQAAEHAAPVLAEVQRKLENRDRAVSKDWKFQSLEGTLKPGGSKSVSLAGAAAIREIQVKLKAADLDQALRSTILKIEFDGNQTVWCPVGDFFGIGHQYHPYRSWYTQAAEDGTMGCWWVMPFAKKAKVSLENLGNQPVEVRLGRIGSDSWNWDENSLHFHSTWRQLYQHQTAGANGKQFAQPNAEDVNFVTVQGQGKYVGDTLSLWNGGEAWWGEGDEKIWVDGEDFPSHFGTGSEDYYGYAWCRPEVFAQPFIAQPCGDGSGNGATCKAPGFTVNSRWRALDTIPFNKSIQFDMELWHWRKCYMNYAPTTFFYARPGAIVSVKPAPEQARLPVAKKLEDVQPALSAGAVPGATKKPNFIIIFTDDQGYGDLGCYGSPDIHTPNIDRMAKEGIRLTSFYAAPFCGPSRSQMMTGCYHARVSHSHNESPRAPTGLHPDEITLAEVLKSAGYATKHIGKWHLGDAPEFLPTNQGFDSFFGIPFSNDMWPYHPKMPPRENEDALMKQMRERAAYTGFAGQGSYYKPGKGFPHPLPLMRGTETIEENPDQTQLTTRYTEDAVRFIEANRDCPFFLYLAHAMPHVPLFVSDKFAGKSKRGLYGDVVAEIDWSCGKIFQTLEKLGIDQDTLVVFTSDNGPWLGYGTDGGSAGPLRDGKGTTWEGGMRVPCIFRWPGTIQAGQRSEAVSGNIDMLPTLAYLAGAKVPDDRVIDGENLWPLLAGEKPRGAHPYFHYFGGAKVGAKPNYRAIRGIKWKLTLKSGSAGELEADELYDLGEDPSERFDRLDRHPKIANMLLEKAKTFYAEIQANRRPLGRIKEEK